MPQNLPVDERWLRRRLVEMERRIKSLETAPRVGNTSVTNGRLTFGDSATENFIVVDATGKQVVMSSDRTDDPSAPAENAVVLYAKNGHLWVRDADGARQL